MAGRDAPHANQSHKRLIWHGRTRTCAGFGALKKVGMTFFNILSVHLNRFPRSRTPGRFGRGPCITTRAEFRDRLRLGDYCSGQSRA